MTARSAPQLAAAAPSVVPARHSPGRPAAATYYGEVVQLEPEGQIRWQRNLTPLCYPKPLYEPKFLRGQ